MKPDWAHASLADLSAHIVTVHHAYCREQIPHIQKLFAAAATEGHGRYPVMAALRGSFDQLSRELTNHLGKEETILFPLIGRIEVAQGARQAPPASTFGSVGNPIRMMVLEHSEAETILAKMRAATGGFAPPAGAGPCLRELCEALRVFDLDMTRHVELEDTVLFPRAIAAEQAALGA